MPAPGYEDVKADFWLQAYEGPVPERNLTWRDVPERPLLQGGWFTQTWWCGQMPISAFKSADNFGVFDTSRQGPRGGRRYGVLDMKKWTAWREAYQRRAFAAEQGRAKTASLRAMGVKR